MAREADVSFDSSLFFNLSWEFVQQENAGGLQSRADRNFDILFYLLREYFKEHLMLHIKASDIAISSGKKNERECTLQTISFFKS